MKSKKRNLTYDAVVPGQEWGFTSDVVVLSSDSWRSPMLDIGAVYHWSDQPDPVASLWNLLDMRIFYSWYLLTILFIVPIFVICWCYALISAHVKKVSNSFNGLGTRHTGGHSVIRKNGTHQVQSVYNLNGNGPIKNGPNGMNHSMPPSPCRTPTRRSVDSIRSSRESQYGAKVPNKIESERCTDRHLNMVILFFVLGVVICWVPYHIFQLLVSATVQSMRT